MRMYVLSIYDRKTKQYGHTMNMRNVERVQQEFDDVCANEKSVYYKNPTDYEVHLLGEFNDSPHHDPELKNLWLDVPRVLAQGRSHANS